MPETLSPNAFSPFEARRTAVSRQLRTGEDWLVQRVLHYARCRGFSRYTPTLEEAWRRSVRELSAAVDGGLRHHEGAPELGPHLQHDDCPLARFARRQARSHMGRGVDLPMFLGLFKYYRLAYQEHLEQQLGSSADYPEIRSTLRRLFDRIEQALCATWTSQGRSELLEDLQRRNRDVTNEKNAYLTVFESLSQAAFLLDAGGRVRNLNHEAMRMLGALDRPGGAYYAEGGVDTAGGDAATRQPASQQQPEADAEAGGAPEAEAAATRSPQAMIGAHIRQLVPFLPPIEGLLSGGGAERSMLEIRGPTCQGLRDFQVSISPMLDVTSRLLGAVVIFQDVTERHELESHLRFLATTDALTGVANRRSLLRRAEHEFRRARRYGRPMALLLLDLDHFKKVNDTWGHFAGDEALKALCEVCLGSLRGSDMLGRLGGEEFAVLLPEAGIKDACGTGERIRHVVEQLEIDWHGRTIRLTVSVGVATLEPTDPDIYALMRRADLALYTAKDVGRNRVVLCADQPETSKLTGKQVEFVLDDVREP
jgi:diguanylate cyclase (GGDEF)-like protein